jgi:pyruvate,water dikinase
MTTQRRIHLIDLAGDPGDLTIGGKAGGLVPLVHAGLPIPPGVVVPAEATDADVDRLSTEVARHFAGTTLAVRSSGVTEDLVDASFAGQFETVLDVVAEPEAIAAAIRRVRSSVVGAHVTAYAAHRSRAMAVLVMPMIDASAAGIAFTRDPVSGADRVVIEAVAGLGHRLASGEESGERWIVEEGARRIADLGVLDAPTAGAIAALARRCEEIGGAPQDVEWALSGGRVMVLQTRAITTHDVEPIPMHDEAPPGPWEWDSTHNRVPMTPLAASMFMPAFERGSRRLVEHYGAPFDHMTMRTINGYLYIQIVPPIGKPGIPPPPAPIMRTMFRLIPALRRRERVAQQAMVQRTDRRLVDQWRTEVRPATEAKLAEWYDTDLQTLAGEELADLLVEAAEEQRSTFGWNMVTDPYYLVPMADLFDFVHTKGLGGLETVTRLLAGSSRGEYRDSLGSLAAALTPELRAEIADGNGDLFERIAAIAPAFAAAYRRHLRAHGQRIMGFDLIDRTMLEVPAVELGRLVTLPPDEDPTPDAQALAAELRSGLPAADARRFDDLLADARATYPIREEGEAVHARTMGAVRLIALEAGRRLVAAEQAMDPAHVCFLELDEITGWLVTGDGVGATIGLRRGQRQWALGYTPPRFFGGHPTVPDPKLFPPNVGRIMSIFSLVMAHDSRPSDLPDGADGVAASPGTYTGPVRIVRGSDDLDRVRSGDVLVAPITTSPWEIVFPHIGALVTEGGGLLSHPAIVAREYRLPAVVGCEGATDRFRDGQLVRVDGTTGTVRVVEPG